MPKSSMTWCVLPVAVDRDVWMIQCGQGLRFSLDAHGAIGIVRKGARQNLDRDVAIQFRAARTKHLSLARLPDRRGDLADAEVGAG